MAGSGDAAQDEHELLRRAEEERKTIVEKYDRGREGRAHIDPWEDPEFDERCHKKDRFGFIQ